MKNKLILFTSVIIFSKPVFAATNEQIENVAAIGASQAVCGYNVNDTMFQIAVNSFFSSSSDIEQGGKYWPQIQENLNRIKS